jgi:hypothetical protein
MHCVIGEAKTERSPRAASRNEKILPFLFSGFQMAPLLEVSED